MATGPENGFYLYLFVLHGIYFIHIYFYLYYYLVACLVFFSLSSTYLHLLIHIQSLLKLLNYLFWLEFLTCAAHKMYIYMYINVCGFIYSLDMQFSIDPSAVRGAPRRVSLL